MEYSKIEEEDYTQDFSDDKSSVWFYAKSPLYKFPTFGAIEIKDLEKVMMMDMEKKIWKFELDKSGVKYIEIQNKQEITKPEFLAFERLHELISTLPSHIKIVAEYPIFSEWWKKCLSQYRGIKTASKFNV